MTKLLAIFLLLAAPVCAEDAAQLESVLASAVGPGQARLFVRHETKYIPRRSRKASAALWDRMQYRVNHSPPVLPGFPVPRSLKDEALVQLKKEAAAVRRTRRTSLRHVTLLIDPAVHDEAVDTARNLVLEGLGLNFKKGESLKVLRVPLTAAGVSQQPPAMGYLQIALWAGVLFAVLFWMLRLAPRRGDDQPRRPLAVPGTWNPGRHPELHRLSRRAARASAEFLVSESGANAANVLASLEIETAAAVFRLMPEHKRGETAAALAAAAEQDAQAEAKGGPAEVRLLEHLERERMRAGLLYQLLLRCPEPMRKSALASVDVQAKAVANAVRRRLVTMSDLAQVDPASLRICLSAFSIRQLALSLYDLDELVREGILAALPELVREATVKELRILVPDTLESVDDARADVYARWDRMEYAGRAKPLKLAAAVLALAFASTAHAQELGLPGSNKQTATPPPPATPTAVAPRPPENSVDGDAFAAAEADLFGEDSPGILPAQSAEDENEPLPGVPLRTDTAPTPAPQPLLAETPAKPFESTAERRTRLIKELGGKTVLLAVLSEDGSQGPLLAQRAIDAYAAATEREAVNIAAQAARAQSSNGARWKLLSTLERLTGNRALFSTAAPEPLFEDPPADPDTTPTKIGALAQKARQEDEVRRNRRRDRLVEKIGGIPGVSLLLRPDDFDGPSLAERSLEAYAEGRTLKAVLLGQAALGADPGNEARREMLRAIAEFSGVPVDPGGILPLRALIRRETTRADTAFFAERFGEALQACRRALLLESEVAEAWVRLGSVYYALGQKDQARMAYIRALDMRPKAPELKRFLRERGWLAKIKK
jgi:tetratricopeptide (TPR) repeat protein